MADDIELEIKALGLDDVINGFQKLEKQLGDVPKAGEAMKEKLKDFFGELATEALGTGTTIADAFSAGFAGFRSGGVAGLALAEFTLLLKNVGEALQEDTKKAEKMKKAFEDAKAAADATRAAFTQQYDAIQLGEKALDIQQKTGVSARVADAQARADSAKESVDAQAKIINAEQALVDRLKGERMKLVRQQLDQTTDMDLVSADATKGQIENIEEQIKVHQATIASAKGTMEEAGRQVVLTGAALHLAERQDGADKQEENSRKTLQRKQEDRQKTKEMAAESQRETATQVQVQVTIQADGNEKQNALNRKREEDEKRHQDTIKKLIGDSAKEATDAQTQAKIAEDALAIMRDKGVTAATAKRMAEDANTDAVLKNAKAVIEATGADEQQTAEYLKNVQAKIDANKKLADMSQQQHAIENTQKQMQGLLGEMNNFGKALTYVFGAMEQDENGAARIKKGMEAAAIAAKALGQAMEFGFGLAKTSISQAMDKALLFSHAQEKLASLSKASAEQKKAEQEAQTQAFLADVAKRATIMALEETAMGIGAAATYQFPSAAAHFVAAGLFGLIAGGTAIGASVIGNTRGNTYAEDEAIKAASKRDTDTNSSGLTSSGDTGSGSDGESSKRPLVINVTAGGGLLATATDLDRAIQKAAAYAARVS